MAAHPTAGPRNYRPGDPLATFDDVIFDSTVFDIDIGGRPAVVGTLATRVETKNLFIRVSTSG